MSDREEQIEETRKREAERREGLRDAEARADETLEQAEKRLERADKKTVGLPPDEE
jgi:hypothetical protein